MSTVNVNGADYEGPDIGYLLLGEVRAQQSIAETLASRTTNVFNTARYGAAPDPVLLAGLAEFFDGLRELNDRLSQVLDGRVRLMVDATGGGVGVTSGVLSEPDSGADTHGLPSSRDGEERLTAGPGEGPGPAGLMIRQHREARGLTREQLIEIVTGLGVRTLLDIEVHGRLPRAATLARIARALDLSLDDLLLNES